MRRDAPVGDGTTSKLQSRIRGRSLKRGGAYLRRGRPAPNVEIASPFAPLRALARVAIDQTHMSA